MSDVQKKSVLPEIIRVGEFFSGPGGMALGASLATSEDQDSHGLGEARVRHMWAVDTHEQSCKTYEANLCKDSGRAIKGDVEAALRGDHGELEPVDLFLFGFPCNDYSIVGESQGIKGKFGPLYKHGVELIRRHNPIAFVAENVSGLLSSRNSAAFNQIVNELANAGSHGYVVTAHMYKLEEYGVPQTRHRIIVVGIRADLGLEFLPPAPTTADTPRTCKDAIEIPPIDPSDQNHKEGKLSPRVRDRLKAMKPGENIWEAMERPDFPEDLKIVKTGATISQIYKRLNPDEPAYTLTASGGGGTHMYHWEHPRPLTNRERARIQTFPDWFRFEGSNEAVRRQIGMAVPPLAAKIIIRALFQTLHGKDDLTPRLEKANVGVFRPTTVGTGDFTVGEPTVEDDPEVVLDDLIISLPRDLNEFVDKLAASGRHRSASEVVQEALRRYENDLSDAPAQSA